MPDQLHDPTVILMVVEHVNVWWGRQHDIDRPVSQRNVPCIALFRLNRPMRDWQVSDNRCVTAVCAHQLVCASTRASLTERLHQNIEYNRPFVSRAHAKD